VKPFTPPGSDSEILPVRVYCSGFSPPKGRKPKCKELTLEYRPGQKAEQNVSLGLAEFTRSVYHLPPRIQDLLEIAAYVFCADRYADRGDRDRLEYHRWSREFEYFIRVRDAKFWNSKAALALLRESLVWITGDRDHRFTFQGGHSTSKVDMLNEEEFVPKEQGEPKVVLFSGGLDSLAGVVDLLESTTDPIWLVSHRSANPGTTRTQEALYAALTRETRYSNRLNYRKLQCSLHKYRAPEESQRTRAFLYCSMGLAMATALDRSEFSIFENGVTALNFAKRADMINARASRTTHPKTVRLLQRLFSLATGQDFRIETPFAFKTKTDVIQVLKQRRELDLMNTSCSCSRTFKEIGPATHCGECPQCIDRR